MNGTSGKLITQNGKEIGLIPRTCPASGEVGEWKDRLVNKNPGWNEVLDKASKTAFSSKENLKFMPRRKKVTSDQPVGYGLTAKQMKRKKPISSDFLLNIEPLTDNQKLLFDAYKKEKNIVAYGAAGTGKTFITLYNAMKEVLDQYTPYENLCCKVIGSD